MRIPPRGAGAVAGLVALIATLSLAPTPSTAAVLAPATTAAVAAPATSAVVASPVLAAGPAAPPDAGARDPAVTGDDEHDAFVGTGGLLLPGSDSAGADARSQLATCRDCVWHVRPLCRAGLDAGSCRGGQPRCNDEGGLFMTVWLARPGEAAHFVTFACLGPDRPRTVDDVATDLRDRIARGLPPLQPAIAPAAGPVTGLPTLLSAGQSAEPPQLHYVLGGYEVTARPVARWAWDFGDGSRAATSSPGSLDPAVLHRGAAGAVVHTYRQSGGVSIGVTARWSATFTIGELGPFAVVDPVLQQATLASTVRQARAVLVLGPSGSAGGAR
ncbi:MAG: hypothetical protein EPO13_06120 [Actinomycetota bacterium]|nr:MAG: hypothetical protein EPO13_06120 [Actinomycetota bacterium]